MGIVAISRSWHLTATGGEKEEAFINGEPSPDGFPDSATNKANILPVPLPTEGMGSLTQGLDGETESWGLHHQLPRSPVLLLIS